MLYAIVPNAVKSHKVDNVVEEVTLVLQVLLNYDSAVEDLLHCASPSSKSTLRFDHQFLGLTFQSIEYDA
ncbi:hypothetical protein DPMN_139787 [Dreissena polymorpha]|uniref:Uncharacterized protein n=1 Tax=Dreissena polymorpha TaxID=45954 RepID=A0A9D4G9M4_DREPO|nr:hypothetical protein DPMN_139787 [Dreissena polymorpha]